MTVKGFNLNYVKALEIHIPDLETQKDVVRLCSGLVESISVIESYYQQKLINLEDLKKSILQKVFSGELTMDNDELTMNKAYAKNA